MKKRRASTPILHSGSKFRHGLLQLMIHSIDPLHDGKLDEKASQLHAIASLRVLLDAAKANGGYAGGVPVGAAPGTCCTSCSTCPSCITCPTCNKPIRPSHLPAPSGHQPQTALKPDVTFSDSSQNAGHVSGPGRQAVPKGSDPLSSFQNVQSSSLVNSLANGIVSERSSENQDETANVNGISSRTGPPDRGPCNHGPISTIMSSELSPTINIIQSGSGSGNTGAIQRYYDMKKRSFQIVRLGSNGKRLGLTKPMLPH